MTRSEDVPGTDYGGIEPALLDDLFALGAHCNVVFPPPHHDQGSGVGDTEIDEMVHAEFSARGDSLAGGDQVNGAKLGGFRSRRMRNSDQVDEGVGRTNQLAVGVGVERIAGDDFAFGGQLGFRARADQYANPVSTLEKNGNEIGADVAGSSRDEDAPGVGRLGRI